MPLKADFLELGSGGERRRIAIRKRAGHAPGLFWLGGYRSDMLGGKAEAFDKWAAEQGRACCRFDYSGHGESEGAFSDGTISRWLEESLGVFDSETKGPQILIGSSMGAWIALRMCQELNRAGKGERLHGVLLIAPAPDFTHELMMPRLSGEQKRRLAEDGLLTEPSEYSDEPSIYTRALFEDGEKNRVMTGLIDTGCPVQIVQGMADPDVPYTHALKLAEFLPAENVTMTLVKDGDHRLSRPEDIELMHRLLERMA